MSAVPGGVAGGRPGPAARYIREDRPAKADGAGSMQCTGPETCHSTPPCPAPSPLCFLLLAGQIECTLLHILRRARPGADSAATAVSAAKRQSGQSARNARKSKQLAGNDGPLGWRRRVGAVRRLVESSGSRRRSRRSQPASVKGSAAGGSPVAAPRTAEEGRRQAAPARRSAAGGSAVAGAGLTR